MEERNLQEFTFPESSIDPIWLGLLLMMWGHNGNRSIDISEYLTPEMKDALKKYEEDRKLQTKESEENEHD